MTLQQLRYFLAAADLGSFTAARPAYCSDSMAAASASLSTCIGCGSVMVTRSPDSTRTRSS